MKTLIIIANPKEDSFSFAMAKKYKALAEKQNRAVKLLDLYRDKQQPFFTYSDANSKLLNKKSAEVVYYQEIISDADELVFIFPYWWGSMPAILKNFIDSNFLRGFAFEYVNARPQGLLTDKTVKVYTTTGAPSFFYTITGANRRLKRMFKKQIIDFCGMKLTGFHIFGGVDTSGKNTKEILQKIKV